MRSIPSAVVLLAHVREWTLAVTVAAFSRVREQEQEPEVSQLRIATSQEKDSCVPRHVCIVIVLNVCVIA